MGKASDVFKTPSRGLHGSRFLFLLVLLILVAGGLLAARRGLFAPARAPEPETSAAAPKPDQGNALGARVKADNETVGVEMQGTTTVAPPPANATPAAGASDNDPFAAVRDNAAMLREEQPAYHRTALQAWELRDADLTGEHAPPLVTRNDLVAHPNDYRGKLVRVRGSLVRVRPQTFNPDPEHPDRPTLFYECVLKLVNEDISVVLVYENPLDAGMSTYRGVVTADGYFFKVWGYNNDAMAAPLLMGPRLVKEPGLSAPSPVGLATFAGVVVVVAAYFWLRHRRLREAQAAADRVRYVPADQIDIPEPHALPRDKFYEDREKAQGEKPPAEH